MTQQKESVVTAERFAKGQPYAEWLKGIDRNLERFEENPRLPELTVLRPD